MALSTYYSYVPRSGDRTFVRVATDEVAICQVASGTIAVGDIASIRIEASEPGNWFRDDARRFAEEVIPLAGGMAEDNQGTITLVIPRHRALAVWDLARRSLPVSGSDAMEVLGKLWQQGCLKIADIDAAGGVDYQPVRVEPERLKCVPGWKVWGDGKVPALWFKSVDDTISVTDGGRKVTAHFGDSEYESPDCDVAFLAIGPPHVDEAFRIMGIDQDLETPDHVELFVGDDSDKCIHVDATRVDATKREQLEKLAYAVNMHSNLPDWAGWRRVFRGEVSREDVA